MKCIYQNIKNKIHLITCNFQRWRAFFTDLEQLFFAIITFKGCSEFSVKVKNAGVFFFALLTAFNFQGAVLFVERVPPQVHHASSSGGYSAKKRQKQNTNVGGISRRQTRQYRFKSFVSPHKCRKKVKREVTVCVTTLLCNVVNHRRVHRLLKLHFQSSLFVVVCWKHESAAAVQ